MQTFSISDARANLKSVLDRVVADKAPSAIARAKGGAQALEILSCRYHH